MSHNILNVNDTEPNRQGEVTALALSDVITVTSPTDGQYLTKDTTNWKTTEITGEQSKGVFGIFPFTSYNVGAYYYGQDDNYIIYKPKTRVIDGISYLNASGSYVPVANNSWWQSLTFSPANFQDKTVILEACITPDIQSSTVIEAQWVIGYTNTYTAIGPPVLITGETWSDTIWGRYVNDGTSTDRLSLKIRSLSGGIAQLTDSVRDWGEFVNIRVYD